MCVWKASLKQEENSANVEGYLVVSGSLDKEITIKAPADRIKGPES